jgi:hypothetical protein
MKIRNQYILNYVILLSALTFLVLLLITGDRTIRMFLLLNILCLSFVKWEKGPGAPGQIIIRKFKSRSVIHH